MLALFSDWVIRKRKHFEWLYEDPTKRLLLYSLVLVKYLFVLCFLLNRGVLPNELAQNSKKKHGRPAEYREMKYEKRNIKFDKSFVQRVLHAGYQHFVPFLRLRVWDAKTLDFYLLKSC